PHAPSDSRIDPAEDRVQLPGRRSPRLSCASRHARARDGIAGPKLHLRRTRRSDQAVIAPVITSAPATQPVALGPIISNHAERSGPELVLAGPNCRNTSHTMSAANPATSGHAR